MVTKAIPEDEAGKNFFWRGVIQRWEASGLESMAEFCRQDGVPINLFYRWRQRLNVAGRSDPEMGFLPIVTKPKADDQLLAGCSNGIKIEIGDGIGITLHDGFDPKLLRSVVAALT